MSDTTAAAETRREDTTAAITALEVRLLAANRALDTKHRAAGKTLAELTGRRLSVQHLESELAVAELALDHARLDRNILKNQLAVLRQTLT